jgi:polyisoprenyl-phosphate glycosyltransferase
MPLQGNTPSISVVSPVYGCRDCLESLVDRISAALLPRGESFEIILVDDASPDDSWTRIREIAATHPSVQGLRLTRNFGQHAAISAGLHYARGARIVVMDCDLQDSPEEIPSLLDALGNGVEVALAQRIDRQDGTLKRLGSWSFYRILGWLTDSPHDHTTANFGAYGHKVIDTINAMPESERFFPLLVRWTGFRTVLVPVIHARRDHGRSSYGFRRLLRLATNVAISFSDKPLRLVIKLGFAFAIFSICVAAFSVYRYSIGDVRIAGFTSIIASVWLVGSVILSSLGIVGLYLGRLFNDTKKRPNFIVAEHSDAAT